MRVAIHITTGLLQYGHSCTDREACQLPRSTMLEALCWPQKRGLLAPGCGSANLGLIS